MLFTWPLAPDPAGRRQEILIILIVMFTVQVLKEAILKVEHGMGTS